MDQFFSGASKADDIIGVFCFESFETAAEGFELEVFKPGVIQFEPEACGYSVVPECKLAHTCAFAVCLKE
jgi:hypothetical protein